MKANAPDLVGSFIARVAFFALLLVLTGLGTPSQADDDAHTSATAAQPAAQSVTGTMTVSGRVTVDGREVQSGATVQNGNVVLTGPQGDAMIDFGGLGKIQLRPNTQIRLMLSPNTVHSQLESCGSMTQNVPAGVSGQVSLIYTKSVYVSATQGEAWIYQERQADHSSRDRTKLKSRAQKRYVEAKEIGTNNVSEATFSIQCCLVETVRPNK